MGVQRDFSSKTRAGGLSALRRLTAAHSSTTALPTFRNCFAGATIPNAMDKIKNFSTKTK